MILHVVTQDRWRVLAVEVEGATRLLDYLEAHESDPDVDKMLALFQRCAEHGPPQNLRKCRYPLPGLSSKIGELKAGALRTYFFYDAGRVIVCSHVSPKPKAKQLRREVAMAESVRDAYLAAQARGEIQIDQ